MRGGRSYRWISLLLIVVVPSCGDDDDDQPSNTTQSESPATTSGSEASRAEDLAIAESAVLTINDFPPGWEEGPVERPSDNPEIEAGIAECLDVPVDELYPDNPQATSPTFTSPQDEEVSSRVTVTPSSEDAQQALERLSGDAVPGCYAQAVEALVMQSLLSSDDVPEGLDFGEVTFNRLSTDQIGDESIAFRTTLPFEYQGFDSQIELDFVLARVGRVGINMSFQSEETSFDPEEARQLTETVVARVETADAG